MEITPAFLPFNEAIEYFNSKKLKISPDSWRDVWAAEHVRAFTVARLAAVDVLEDIRGAVSQAVEKGLPIDQFRSNLSALLQSKGWLAKPGEKPGQALTRTSRLEWLLEKLQP